MHSRSTFFCLWGEEGSFKDFLNFDVPNVFLSSSHQVPNIFTLVLTNSWFLEEPLSFGLEFFCLEIEGPLLLGLGNIFKN
jgi:hypothetical protein